MSGQQEPLPPSKRFCVQSLNTAAPEQVPRTAAPLPLVTELAGAVRILLLTPRNAALNLHPST